MVNPSTTGNLIGVVRGKEDNQDYVSNTLIEAMAGETHRWQIVKVDGNRLIQGYIGHTAIGFKLRGHTLVSNPSYFTTPFDIIPSTLGQCVTVDVSGYVGVAADDVILLVDSVEAVETGYAIRETGSSFVAPVNQQLPRYATTM